ncbi:Protein FAM71D [Bienertia sinuspersici]
MKPNSFFTPKKAILEQKVDTKHPDPNPTTPEEISEVSEMCSFSESISTTTLKEEDDQLHQFHKQNQHQNSLVCSNNTKDTAASGEARQRVFRSQGYNGNFANPHHHQHQQQIQQQHCKISQGRSPARRRPETESSPARKRYPGPNGPKREVVGDNSGRRSQSPAKRANVGRSPSGRRTGPSPGRVRMVHGPENGRKMKEEEEKEEEEESEMRRESEEWQGPKESLENPLVSLECFIFL